MIQKSKIKQKLKNKILDLWEKYTASYGNAIKKGYKSNAFSPLVWFNIFVIPLLLFTAFATKKDVVEYSCLIGVGFIILFSLVMYITLLIKDPKLLQSESFRLENRKLDLIAQKGKDISIEPMRNN